MPAEIVAVLRKAGGPRYRAVMTRKGGKHVSRCPGPWVIAFFVLMPPRPVISGSRRAALGIADVSLDGAVVEQILLRRAVCALVAILPEACASFIIGNPIESIRAMQPREVALRVWCANTWRSDKIMILAANCKARGSWNPGNAT